jgi:membrane-associated phospholipid phosphatase
MIQTHAEEKPVSHSSSPLIALLSKIQALDEWIIREVVQLRPQKESHPINLLMKALTRVGDWDSWTFGLVALFFLGGELRTAALATVPPLVATFLLSHVLKRVFKRSRPSVKIPGLARLLGNPDAFSFPSAHTACAWAACLGLGSQFSEWTVLFGVLAFGISWSRLHVGAHYLSDILCGAFLGVMMVRVL